LVKREKVQQTINNINADVSIVKSFVQTHNRLPTSDEFPSIAQTTKDSWGKNLVYKYADNLTDNNSICYENNTSLEIKICENSSCSEYQQLIKNVAYLIASSGANYNMQTNFANNEIKIYVPGVKVDDNSSDIQKIEPYDDIVKWVTLDELKNIAQCKEAALHILNNSLPYGYVNQEYNATIYAQGGLQYTSGGKYKWCYEGTLPPGLSANPNYQSNDCLANKDLWKNADNFNISGTPSASGDYKITVYVGDNAGNVDKRSFVITINPANSSSTSGTSSTSSNTTNNGNTNTTPPIGGFLPGWLRRLLF
jgi:hypothetical protein